MRRLLILAVAAAVPAPAQAAVRLGPHANAHALTATRGSALAIVDSRRIHEPFALVRSTGSTRTGLGRFGERRAEFPDLASDAAGRVVVGYGVPISGGAALTIAPLQRTGLGDPLPELVATGPARLALGAAGTLVAYPDEEGNVALATLERRSGRRPAPRPGYEPLTASGPERRHLPLGVVAAEAGALVLDLAQERGRSELRVLGPHAPAAAVLSVRGVRHIPARIAASGDRVAVGYLVGGRAYLAVSRAGGSWSRRRLRGAGGGAGAPAPMFAAGELLVAYTQRVRRAGAPPQREVYLFRARGTRRLTTTRGDEREPLAAAGPDGRAYVAWTRREPRQGAKSAFLERVR